MPETILAAAPERPAPETEPSTRRWRPARGWPSVARRVAAVVAPFVLWDMLALVAQSRLLPGPLAVVETLWSVLLDGTIWYHAQQTAQRGVIGLSIAIVAGVLLGVAMATVRWMESAIEPLVSATYPVPKLALYPLLILLLGFGAGSKIAMVAMECFYPIVLTTYAAVRSIDKHYFWLARNVEAGRAARLRIIMRATSPSLVAAIRMAMPIMLVIMVVTELLGESRGLGYLIRRASAEFDPQMTMAVVLLLAILGFVLDRLVVFVGNRVGRWAGEVTL